jgi:acetyl-CoA acyltransferase
MITSAYICDAIRTPFGRYGGVLSSVRADDLAAIPLVALMVRNPNVDWEQISDVLYGCANQAGEDNRNVARMASLLAGLPTGVSAATINRLCGSGLDAIGSAARAIRSGEATMMIAGGVESMSRAPYVVGKAETAFARTMEMADTTIGWRFVNKLMQAQHGIDSMPETAENVAREFGIDRLSQDRFALASHTKALAAQKSAVFDAEITPVTIAQKKGDPLIVTQDEHPRNTSIEALAGLAPVVASDGTVTAGKLVGHQRWRLRIAAGMRKIRAQVCVDAESARARHGDRRRSAAHHGNRAGTGSAQGIGADGTDDGANGCDRTQ